ncbi:MAG: transcription antitermination factor NusB, partial [Hymenobacter sp.]
MQALYAYQQAVAADLLLAQDRIAAAFEPDLNAKVTPDRRLLEGQRKLGEAQLRDWHRTGEMPESGSDDQDVAEAVRNAMAYYQQLVKKEHTFYGGQLLHGAESIHDQYLHLLNMPQALLQLITEDNERETRRFTGPRFEVSDTARLFENAAFAKVKENEQLLQTTIKHKLQWDDSEELDALREAWQKEMKPDETVQAYLAGKNTGLAETDYETDMELLRHLYKDFVFKGEALPRWLESSDLNWEENRPIVRNLVLKTLKMLPYAADEKQELMNLSANWQDDRDFAETLYNQTLADDA